MSEKDKLINENTNQNERKLYEKNIKVYKKYKMFSYDFLFYFAVRYQCRITQRNFIIAHSPLRCQDIFLLFYESLCSSYIIDTAVGQIHISITSVAGNKVLVTRQFFFCLFPHILVRLYRKDFITATQQLSGKNPGSGANIREDASGRNI